jgi:heat shock protein HslJ
MWFVKGAYREGKTMPGGFERLEVEMKRYSLFILALLALVLAACQPGQGGGASGGEISGVEWKLSQLNGSAPIAGRDVTLKIDGTQAGGNAGCNGYGGTVALDGAKVSFSELMQTEMACMDPVGIMDQETAFLQTLSQAASFSATADRLELKNAAGETVLVFMK